MAIGLGKMLGFDFMENFNYPYIAQSITDFWRRWHISLSSWFRDYLYIPLGGNRKGKRRQLFNILVVWAYMAWQVGF
jgi:alginate O-acetyltransferase complex protein AlgI